jgi:hypothetical protein
VTARSTWVVGILVVAAVGWIVSANVAPTMEDQAIATTQGGALVLELRATDEDVDALAPEGHPLAFTILQGPAHGVLMGDLAAVRYEPPHDAMVELTYVPAQGFVGTDLVVVSVTDPFGGTSCATTTIRIEVALGRPQGLLSGNWTTGTTYDVQSGEFTVFRTSLTETYRVDRLTAAAAVDWKLETQSGSRTFLFDALRLKTDVELWDIDFSSTLEFDPEAVGVVGGHVFDYWRATASFALLGAQFAHTLYVTIPQTESYQLLAAQAMVCDVSAGGSLRFDLDDDCGFVLGRTDLYAGWRWCDIGMRASFSVTCAGFEQAHLGLSGVPVPLFGGILPGVTFDFDLVFKPDAKTFSASLDWQPIWIDCLKIMAELDTGVDVTPMGSAETIAGIGVCGLKVECEIPSGVRLVSATSLHPDYNSRMTGLTDYFEVFRISGPLAGCCGIPGYFGIATYFYAGSTWLFDWGMTSLSFDLGAGEQLSLSFGLVIHSGELTKTAPWTEVSAGWTVRW